MDINDLTVGQVMHIKSLFGDDKKSGNEPSLPFEIGKKYLFRTVTQIDIGEVESICGGWIVLKSASWIADTGRFYDCLKIGLLNGVEPYPSGTILNSSVIVDAAPWDHELPTEQK